MLEMFELVPTFSFFFSEQTGTAQPLRLSQENDWSEQAAVQCTEHSSFSAGTGSAITQLPSCRWCRGYSSPATRGTRSSDPASSAYISGSLWRSKTWLKIDYLCAYLYVCKCTLY